MSWPDVGNLAMSRLLKRTTGHLQCDGEARLPLRCRGPTVLEVDADPLGVGLGGGLHDEWLGIDSHTAILVISVHFVAGAAKGILAPGT